VSAGGVHVHAPGATADERFETRRQGEGKTVAELGNRNRPLDMIVYQKDGKDYLLLANSSRGMMKITTDQIEKRRALRPLFRTRKVCRTKLSQAGRVWNSRSSDPQHALVVRRTEGGSLNLESLRCREVKSMPCDVPGPWLCSRMVAAEEA